MTESLKPSPPEGYGHLLERPLFAHVAVVAPDGTPRSYPMWFVLEDGLLHFTNTANRPQTRWLADRPDLAISILDPDNPYRYLGASAVVESITPDPTGALFDRLAAIYGLDVKLPDPSDRVDVAARPIRYWKQ